MGNNSIQLAPIWWFLTVLFAALKLAGIINWSWLVVTFPLWGSLLLSLLLFSLAVILQILAKIFGD